MKKLFAILFSCALASCGDGMLHEYLNADGAIWTNADVNVDSTGYAEITVQVTGSTPELTVLYGCEESLITRLYRMDAELIVDGEVVSEDESNFNVSYANASENMPLRSSGDSIAARLGIDSTQYMESFSLSVNLSKKYSSMGSLPEQLSVHFTSEAAGGDTDTTIVLTLRSSKDTRAPIRIH